MSAARLIAIALLASACGAGNTVQELGTVSFEVPGSWRRADSKRSHVETAVFKPSDNEEKESITVIRTEIGPIAGKYDTKKLTELLVGAQATLPRARVSNITPVATKHGFAGVRLAVNFVPPGLVHRYHRVHVVFADGPTLVHVLYTAREPDAELRAFQLLIDSIQRES